MNYAEISSANVRKLLVCRKCSLRQIAAEIGVSGSTLSDAMRSRHGLSINHLAAIAACFQVPLDALCDPDFDPAQDTVFSQDFAHYRTIRQSLDAHGRKLVNAVLAIELERCTNN